jgi:hypothetical protein
MHTTRRVIYGVVALLLIALATEHPLMAYTDPGSGAMFVQIILAAIIGGLFKIRSLASRFRRKKDPETNIRKESLPQLVR